MKILHIIDSLGFNASARQLMFLAPALAHTEVCCLGPSTPWSESLRQAGVKVRELDWTRWLDFGALCQLRDIVRQTQFDFIHVWRLPTLRALAVVARDLLPRVVMNAPLPYSGKLSRLDRWVLSKVRCLALCGASDQDRCEKLNIAVPMHVITPAVESRSFASPSVNAPLRIACVGAVERHSGFRQAIWAMDFLRYKFADLQLQIVGDGSQIEALRNLARGMECEKNVQFLGARADATNVLANADVVWAPSLANCGRQVALEAMAAGRPVVASDVPCLRDVIQNGETGYLVPPGDVVQLLRCTKRLLDNEAERRKVGATAQRYVQEHYAPQAVVAQWREVYALAEGQPSVGSPDKMTVSGRIAS